MSAWRIDSESVSHDLLNGEVIAIHLGTGIYYSLRGSAATVWEALLQPADVDAIAAVLVARHEIDLGGARKAVGVFLERLCAEALVKKTTEESAVVRSELVEPRRAFEPPQLERFADLQDLLLLDPIHDVGAQGWPQRPAASDPV